MTYKLYQPTLDAMQAYCENLAKEYPKEVDFILDEMGPVDGASYMATLGMYFYFIQNRSKIKNIRFAEFIEFLKITLNQEVPDVPQAPQ